MVPYSINLQLRSEENRFLWKFLKYSKGRHFTVKGINAEQINGLVSIW